MTEPTVTQANRTEAIRIGQLIADRCQPPRKPGQAPERYDTIMQAAKMGALEAMNNTRTASSPAGEVEAWLPMKDAPRDHTRILAITGQITDERWSHLSNREFVVFHLGKSERAGLDLGWSLFPGMGCGDDWLAGWRPIYAHPPALALCAAALRAHIERTTHD